MRKGTVMPSEYLWSGVKPLHATWKLKSRKLMWSGRGDALGLKAFTEGTKAKLGAVW
jgi:hypothetical protein